MPGLLILFEDPVNNNLTGINYCYLRYGTQTLDPCHKKMVRDDNPGTAL